MFVLKGISILINLAFVPLLLNSLNEQRYGIWITITTIISWFSIFDIGLCNGLRNKLAECIAKCDFSKAKEYVSTTYIMLLYCLLPLSIILTIITHFVDWTRMFNTNTVPNSELEFLMFGIIILIILQIFFKTIQSILYSLQKPFEATLVVTLGQILAFILVWCYQKFSSHIYLPYLGFLIAGAPVIIFLIYSFFIFHRLQYLRPSVNSFNKSLRSDIFSIGQKFFWIQLSSLILFQSNNFIIIQICGDSSVTQYNIAYKYLSLVFIAFSIISTPFWSITTDLFTKGQYDNIWKFLRRQEYILWGLTLVGILMIFASPIIYRLWLGDFPVNTGLLSLLLLYFITMMYWQLYGNIINGIGYIKLQFIIISAECLIYIPLAILLTNIFNINGAILALLISNLPNVFWPKIQLRKLFNKTAKGIWKE